MRPCYRFEREARVKAPLVLRFIDRSALEQEHAENFAHGRAFVWGVSGYELFSPCRLVIEHPENGAQCDVDVEVIMVRDEGIALQFRDRSPEELQRVSSFIASGRCADNHNADEFAAFEHEELDLPSALDDSEWDEDAETGELPDSDEEESEPSDAAGACASEAGRDDAEDATAEDGDGDDKGGAFNAVMERQLRMRNLEIGERLRIARGSNQEQRVLLERIYGSSVWEPLLRNPKITVPEVARIAKKGTISRPLIDLICENEQWIHQSIVRRALLANPRLGPESAMKVLRTLPQRELKLVPHQRAYPATVRSAAARLIKT